MPVILEIHASSNYTSQKFLCAARQEERKKETKISGPDRKEEVEVTICKALLSRGISLLFEKQKESLR